MFKIYYKYLSLTHSIFIYVIFNILILNVQYIFLLLTFLVIKKRKCNANEKYFTKTIHILVHLQIYERE